MAEIKRILVSQPKPAIIEKSPFFELANKYELEVDYRPLIEVQGVTPKEFRSQQSFLPLAPLSIASSASARMLVSQCLRV